MRSGETGYSGTVRGRHALVVNPTTGQTAGWAVNDAIRTAARATGTRFEYLLATAKVESDLDPKASSSTSSARGLFQFIDQTWLATMKGAGPRLGLSRYADAITQTGAGRYEVSDPAMRSTIMGMRNDPATNALMAGAFTQGNATKLAGRLGRPPSDGELYIAHFLGSAGAAKLIALASNSPGAVAADAFPNAARANRSIFYDGQGHARTAAQVYGTLVGRYDTACVRTSGATTVAASSAAKPDDATRIDAELFSPQTYTAQPQVSAVSAENAAAAPLFQGLFRSDPNRPPVSRFIQDLWASRPHVAAALSGAASAPGAGTGSRASGQALDLYSEQAATAQGLFTGRS